MKDKEKIFKLTKYNATFRFISKNILFLQTCSTTCIKTSLIEVGAAVGRVPRVSFRVRFGSIPRW